MESIKTPDENVKNVEVSDYNEIISDLKLENHELNKLVNDKTIELNKLN